MQKESHNITICSLQEIFLKEQNKTLETWKVKRWELLQNANTTEKAVISILILEKIHTKTKSLLELKPLHTVKNYYHEDITIFNICVPISECAQRGHVSTWKDGSHLQAKRRVKPTLSAP